MEHTIRPQDLVDVIEQNDIAAVAAMLAADRTLLETRLLVQLPPHGFPTHTTPLVITAAFGKLEIVRFLAEQGADMHVFKDEALQLSAENGHLDVVRFLVEHDADVHAQEDYALRWSAENGHLDVVRFLVEHDADVHAQEDYALRRSKVRPSWPRAQDAGRPSAC